MAEVILMPRLSDTMTEGVIAAWHKNVGDAVKKGDLLAEIETDKATMELESYQEGVLLHIGTTKGGKLQVNDLLAIIGKSGEDISEILIKYQRDISNILPVYEQPNETTIDLPKQLLEKVRYIENYQFEIVNWYKNEGDLFNAGDKLFDIVIDDKIYKIGINITGTLIQIIEKSGSNLNLSNHIKKGLDVCKIKCLFSEITALPGDSTPLYILDSFFYFKQLEEHPYLKYTKVQLDLYERFLDIESKAIQISHSELEINNSSLKQQSLIEKEKKEEKEKEEKVYWGWLKFIILFPFIIIGILKLFGVNIGEILMTGIFSASILAIGISKKF